MIQHQTGEIAIGANANSIELVEFKHCLSESRFRIKLDDQVNAAVRATLVQLSNERFPLNTAQVTGKDFTARLATYELSIRSLQEKAVLLGKWATPAQLPTLINLLARLSDGCTGVETGSDLWLSMRWYPVSLLFYSTSIAALSSGNYDALAAIHNTKILSPTRRSERASVSLLVPIVEAMVRIAECNAWKCTEQYRTQLTPESEHLFGVLRAVTNDLLFLGSSYEYLFDRYEILRALLFADMTDRGWAPVGRFGRKYCIGGQNNPYSELRTEAKQQQDKWGPIQAGLFGGSYDRFEKIASKFENELLNKLNWF